jgi:alkanesulfonate monooxygenase SsuD/methylene tetrahydromethanopterin reductase-like flavin-dependent oxidoreductase (luciferase family)
MLILFDHGTPRGLARELAGHTVRPAKAMGWEQLNNGDLLQAAEEAGFDVLLTTDQRIRYQQNLEGRKIAIVVLSGSSKWSRVRLQCERIAAAMDVATPGSYAEVFIPFR